MTRRPSCPSGKTRYRDRIRAELVLARILRSRHENREKTPRRVYPCPHCGGWHLTSQLKRTEEYADA